MYNLYLYSTSGQIHVYRHKDCFDNHQNVHHCLGALLQIVCVPVSFMRCVSQVWGLMTLHLYRNIYMTVLLWFKLISGHSKFFEQQIHIWSAMTITYMRRK